MNGFDAMTDGDLILCVNLLHADARNYEQMSNKPEHQAILRERAEDRRALAARMKAEVDRRGAERWGNGLSGNCLMKAGRSGVMRTLKKSPS